MEAVVCGRVFFFFLHKLILNGSWWIYLQERQLLTEHFVSLLNASTECKKSVTPIQIYKELLTFLR